MLRAGGSRLVAPGLRRLLGPGAGERAAPGLAAAGARAYHERVVDHYNNPRNVGSFDKDDPNVGTGLVGAPACGDVMKLQIRVDDGTGKIVDACFKTFGCGSAIASSSVGEPSNSSSVPFPHLFSRCRLVLLYSLQSSEVVIFLELYRGK